MTNSLTDYNPELWAAELLRVLRNNFAMPRLVTRDFDATAFSPGDVVNVQKPAAFTSSTKAKGASYVDSDANASNVPVTLDTHRYVSFTIESREQAETPRRLIETYIEPAAIAIAEGMNQDLIDLIPTLTNSVGDFVTPMDRERVTATQRIMTTNKAPQAPRHMVLSEYQIEELLNDDSFTAADGVGDGGTTLMTGVLRSKFGFDFNTDQQVIIDGGGVDQIHGAAFHPHAFGIISRPLAPVPTGVGAVEAALVDPDINIAARTVMSWDKDKGGVKTVVELLYGKAVLRDELGVEVRSQKT